MCSNFRMLLIGPRPFATTLPAGGQRIAEFSDGRPPCFGITPTHRGGRDPNESNGKVPL